MFDQLVNEAASRFNLSAASVSALVRGLLSLISNERTGGAAGFVDLFRRAGLGDVVTSWFGGREGKLLTPAHLESALGTTTLDRLATASGLTRGLTTSALTFLLPRVMGQLTPGGALPSTRALLPQISGFMDRSVVDRTVGRDRPPVTERPTAGMLDSPVESRGVPGWVPWAALAALSLLALLWFRSPSGTVDPTLTLSNQDGKVTYSGLVRDESTRTQIVDALRRTFGEANVQGDLRIDGNVRRASWLPHVGDIFATLQIPGVQFALNGDAVKLGGWLSAADRQALGDRLQTIFGAQAAIGSLGEATLEAVRAANEKALSALEAVGTSGASADDLVGALNLSIVNFASGSSEIPVDAREVIRNGAAALERATAGTTIEIGGHTDNTGDPANNVALSQARADAVKRALVAAGAPSAMLVARGYGDTRPRATNDTEYGRFQNRRIEYAVATPTGPGH
jgi:outer membrane protein OmpA-like peptidoglycan-associated protein/uncharacterized protein YidB (DUF937 family)